jgi:hypothetical protein
MSEEATAINKNLILYIKSDGELVIKVTDFQKGYWAETPLNGAEVLRIIKSLKWYVENKSPNLIRYL